LLLKHHFIKIDGYFFLKILLFTFITCHSFYFLYHLTFVKMVTEHCSCCAQDVWNKARGKLPKKLLGQLVNKLTVTRTGCPGTPGYCDSTTRVVNYCHSCGTGAAYPSCSNCEYETSYNWISGTPDDWTYHNHICVCDGNQTFTKKENKKFQRFMQKHCSA